MRVLTSRRRAVVATTSGLLAAAVATATSSVATTGQADAGHRSAGTRSTLGAVTLIEASHPARMYVVLPKAVALRPGQHGFGFVRGLTIHGAGRIYGMTLADPRGRRGFAAMTYAPCFARGCARGLRGYRPAQLGVTWDVTAPIDQPADAPLRLPAGAYVLSVFTDGAPVQVEWRIPGLAGDSELHLQTPQNLMVTTPTDTAYAGPVRTESLFSGAATLHTDIVLLAYANAVAKDAHVTSDSSWCIYSDDAPPGDRPLPECLGGSGATIGMTYVTLATHGMGYGLFVAAGPDSAGRYYQSVDDSGVQAISDSHANLLWADAGWLTQ